jgi:hypothetical protein
VSEYRYRHEGGCGCGALRIGYLCDLSLEELTLRACQCHFCLPRGASYLSAPSGRLEVRLRERGFLYAHVFGTGTAEFMHCAFCNHLVFVRSHIQGNTYGLVLAQALDDSAAASAPRAVSYADESLAERLARRAAHWIPELEIIEDEN